jgi:WD40 repeat protein/tetratricopeptide (TPR) repeat protein
VQKVAFSADGKTLLTVTRIGDGSSDTAEVRRWDPDTGEPIGSPIPHQGFFIERVAFSPDGKIVLTGKDKQTAQLWDVDTGLPRGAPLPHRGFQRSDDNVIFSADGRLVLIAEGDTVQLWETATGKSAGKSLQRGAWPAVVGLSPDGQILLTASKDRPQLWRAATGEPLGPPLPHPGEILTAAFSPDGKRVLLAGRQQISVWGVPGGEATGWRYSSKAMATKWAISPDNIAVAYGTNKPEVWAAGPYAQVYPMGWTLDHPDPVTVADVSPDGNLIATGSGQAVRVWWTHHFSWGMLGWPMQHPGGITALAFSPDGQSLLTACTDGTVRLWDLPRPADRDSWPLVGHGIALFTALSADGTTLLRPLETVASFQTFAQVWDTTTRKPQGAMLPVGYGFPMVAASPDGRKVLLFVPSYQKSSPGPNGTQIQRSHPAVFWLWQSGQWKRLPCPPGVTLGHNDPMAFGPDGSTVLLASRNDGRARLCDLATWTPVGPPLEHPEVAAVAVAPDGRTVATAGSREARLWDALAGQQIGPPLQHQGAIHAVAFSPDGRVVATASRDHTARLWSVATGAPIHLPLTHPQGVLAVAFRPDGSSLLTAGADNKVRFWDAQTGRSLGPPSYLRGAKALAFSGDGQSALAVTESILLRWAVPPPPPEADAKTLVLWVEVMTGRNLDAAEVVGWLTPQQWNERRKQLLAQGGPPVPAEDKLAWHRHWAEALKDHSYRTRWHLDRLIAAEPRQWQHYLARGGRRPFGETQERLADCSQAIALGAQGPQAWEWRALTYARLGQWDQAAADYQEAAQRGASDALWCQHAEALWKAGQTDAYRRACADLLDRLQQTGDAQVAHHAARVCLLDPTPRVDLGSVVRLAEKALAEPYEGPPADAGWLSDANRIEDRTIERRETLALALYRAGRHEVVIECLSQRPQEDALRRSRPSSPPQSYFFLLAMAHQRLGRADQAREYLVQAVACPQAGWVGLRQEAEAFIRLQPAQRADAHYRLGLTFEKDRQWDRVVAELKNAIALQPDHRQARVHLGQALLQQGQALLKNNSFDGAITAYHEALRLEVNAAEVRGPLAAALNGVAWRLAAPLDPTLRAPRRAVQLAKEAVGVDPGQGMYWNTLGVAHYRAAEAKPAIPALEKSMELRSGGDSLTWFFLAMAHWQLGDKELARRWYAPAVLWMEKHRPTDPELARFRAEAAELLGLPRPSPSAGQQAAPEEVEIWSCVLAAKPGFPAAAKKCAEAHNQAGIHLLHGRKLDQAIAEFRQAIALDPSCGAALWCLSALLANGADPKLRDPHQAVKLAKRGVALEGHAGWWQILGWAYYRAGAWKDSVAALEKSLELAKAGADADQWLFLAMAHWQLGHKAEARRWYDRSVQWIEKNQAILEKPEWTRDRLVDDVCSFRAEAAKLLGVRDKK